jgi:bile-acid 7alpha-dehydratase
MADLIDLEKRVKILEEECRKLKDIEAIKNLKSRYWHCVDEQSWEGVADCFAEKANVFGVCFEGRNLVARFIKRTGGKQYVVTAHQGHNPEINLLTGETAAGRWLLDQFGIEAGTNNAIKLGLSYEDEYIKEKNVWKIKSTKVTVVYQQSLKLEEFPQWAKAGGV